MTYRPDFTGQKKKSTEVANIGTEVSINVKTKNTFNYENCIPVGIGRPMDVYMKSALHIDVHWTFKGRPMSTGIGFLKFSKYRLFN